MDVYYYQRERENIKTFLAPNICFLEFFAFLKDLSLLYADDVVLVYNTHKGF